MLEISLHKRNKFTRKEIRINHGCMSPTDRIDYDNSVDNDLVYTV